MLSNIPQTLVILVFTCRLQVGRRPLIGCWASVAPPTLLLDLHSLLGSGSDLNVHPLSRAERLTGELRRFLGAESEVFRTLICRESEDVLPVLTQRGDLITAPLSIISSQPAFYFIFNFSELIKSILY